MNNEVIKDTIKNKWYELAPNTAMYFDSVASGMVIVSVRFYYKGEIMAISHTLHTGYVTEPQYLSYFIKGLMNEYEHIIIDKTVGDLI